MADIRNRNSGNRGGRRGRNGMKRRAGKGTRILWLVVPLALLSVNLFLLLQTRGRMHALNESLNRALGRLEALEEDAGIVPPDAAAAQETVSHAAEGVSSYVQQVALNQVDPPRERTYEEILERLDRLGRDSALIEQVASHAEEYPQQLLEALANNPEMGDFAAHYPEKKGTVTGEGLTEAEKAEDFPLFLQWDPRWGYAPYGDDSVVGLSGCGPTALSMVLYYLTGNEQLTPDKIAAYSMENGYYISGTGTAWLLMEDVPALYGIHVSQPEASLWQMEQALDRGDMIICSMGPGDFTVGGHFVVIYGYTDKGFLVRDPNSVARSHSWSYERLEGQIKNMWVFSGSARSAGDEVQYIFGD